MPNDLVAAIVNIQEDAAVRLVQEAVGRGDDAERIVNDCREAAKIVKERFDKSEYSLPEVIMSGETIRRISGILGRDIPEADSLGAIEQAKSGKGQDDSCGCGPDS